MNLKPTAITLFIGIISTLPTFGGLAKSRPNIILMIADDMAWNDCGAYGNDKIRTPNLDQLAKEGMKFERAFLTISSCSPSRSSIITGRYPHNTDAEQLHWPLPDRQITFVEKLKAAGYWTGSAGKWHLGDAIRERFDRIKDVDTSGFQLPSGKAALSGKIVQTSSGDAKSGCADWVPLLQERDKDKPFFLWLAALDPHRDYDENIIKNPTNPEDTIIPPYLPDLPDVRKDFALYYDEIVRLDRYVGEVRAELKKQKVEENTIVIFISDNGRPFPRAKTTCYDSGIRTPWIVAWPGKVQAGSICENIVSSIDLAPTFLQLAGVDITESFQGKSFLPLLENPTNKIRDYAYAEANWHDFEKRVRAVRSMHFKYMHNDYEDLPNTPSADSGRSLTFQAMVKLHKKGKLGPEYQGSFTKPRPKEELYDLRSDPFEMKNLINDPAHTKMLATLRQELERWKELTGDHLPPYRTADEFDRVSGAAIPSRRTRPRQPKTDVDQLYDKNFPNY